MMVKAIIRDSLIAGRARWETNEKTKVSLNAEQSALSRVSARPLRSLLKTTGLVQSTRQRTLGNRTSTMATRTTTIRTIQTMLGVSGGKGESCKLT